MRTTIAMILALLCAGCIDVKVGTQKVNIYEQYPVYQVEQKPALENLTGEDNDPHKTAALMAQKLLAKAILTAEEKKQFEDAMAAAETLRVQALAKKVANDRALIKWGRSNQATLEVYNEYAKDKNERLKVAEAAK